MMSSPRPQLFSFLLLLIFLCVSECKGAFSPTPNYARYESPNYTVVLGDNNLEIRTYADALWVYTPRIPANSHLEAVHKAFPVLLDYYRGGNRQHENISLTTPVLVDIRDKSYEVHLYIPQRYQNSLPWPLNLTLIEVVKLPIFKYVAVRKFGGIATDHKLSTQIALLKKSLEGTPYRAAASLNQTSLAVYNNRPFDQSQKGVNEVFLWFDSLV